MNAPNNNLVVSFEPTEVNFVQQFASLISAINARLLPIITSFDHLPEESDRLLMSGVDDKQRKLALWKLATGGIVLISGQNDTITESYWDVTRSDNPLRVRVIGAGGKIVEYIPEADQEGCHALDKFHRLVFDTGELR